MKYTGERLINGIEGVIKTEHLHRYAIANELVCGKIVLDIACGDGYGSNLLSSNAKEVYGVDIDKEVISYASQKYKKSNLHFKVGDIRTIPFVDNFFDIIVCFETFEHVTEHENILLEFKRVLNPSGILIMSTPEKKTYSDITNYKNPFHLKELYADEYETLLKNNFNNNQILTQKHLVGSFAYCSSSVGLINFKGSYEEIIVEPSFKPMYIISISSDFEFKKHISSLFIDSHISKKEDVMSLRNIFSLFKKYIIFKYNRLFSKK